MNYTDSIVCRVRKGRGWATIFDWPNNLTMRTRQALDIVMDSVVTDIRPNVGGKKIHIPNTLPTNIGPTLRITE